MGKKIALILEQLEDRIFLDANPIVVADTADEMPVDPADSPVILDDGTLLGTDGESSTTANIAEPTEGNTVVDDDSEGNTESDEVVAPNTEEESENGKENEEGSNAEMATLDESTDDEKEHGSKVAESVEVLEGEDGLSVETTSSAGDTLVEVVDPLLGEEFTFTVTMENTTANTLYGPYIDLFFESGSSSTPGDEANPADPDNDGIIFDSATYLGVTLTPVELIYNGTDPLLHPFAVDSNGDPVEITQNPDGTALQEGDTLYVLQMPFGSYAPTQAAAPVVVTAHISEFSMLDLAQGAGEDLGVQVSNGFQFGTDELQNPVTDPSIVNLNTDTMMFRPEVLAFQKNYTGPEQETATGRNYPRQYTIQVDIADGQTIDHLTLTEQLPDEIHLIGTPTVVDSAGNNVAHSISITSTDSSALVDSASYTNGVMGIQLDGTIVGTSSSQDLLFTFDYYVPEFYSDDSTPILGGACNEEDTSIVNDVQIEGDWTPVDTDDQDPVTGSHHFVYDTEVNLTPGENYGQFGSDPSNDEEITAKSFAIQKDVFLETDGDGSGDYSPGDIVRYELDIQISDYLSFGDIEIVDTMGDGLELYTAAGFSPSLSVVEGGAIAQNTTFDLSDATEYEQSYVFQGGHRDTEMQFHVSQTMLNDDAVFDDNTFSDGVLEGGYTNGSSGGATTMTLIYYAIVNDDYFSVPAPGTLSVDQGDVLDNGVIASGNVYGYEAGNLVDLPLCPESDTSSAQFMIDTGHAQKEFFLVNGVAPVDMRIAPGDEVTFRLTYTLPTSDVELFSLTDYLPQPVFDATSVTIFDGIVNDSPLVGHASYGSNDTFHTILVDPPPDPSIATNGAENTIVFNYGNYDAPLGSGSSVVEILFTVEVSNDPFADGLYLTNMLVVTESDTAQVATDDQVIAGFTLDQPELTITKGVVEAGTVPNEIIGNEGSIFWSGHVSDPGTAGFRFDGTVDSADLLANSIDDNLTGTDAYDYVTYAIVIENEGHYNAFDIEINDVLPEGHTGLDVTNLTITDGNGVAIGWSGDLFGVGIELDDAVGYGSAGLENVSNADGGHNVVIITYDLLLSAVVAPSQTLTNTASLTHYTSSEGYSESFVDPASPLTDDATVATTDPLLLKEIVATNQSHTAGNDVVIGEIVTYRVTMTIPEGTMYEDLATGDGLGVELRDSLDSGLALVNGSMTIVSASAGLTSSNGAIDDANLVTNHLSVDAGGAGFTLDFGELSNTNTVNADLETIVVEYQAVVLNVVGNTTGTALDNQVTLYYDEADGSDHHITDDAPDVTVVEPELTVVKTVDNASPDAGDTVHFTITVTNSGTVTAFDISLADTMPLDGLTVQNDLIITDELGNPISWTGVSGSNDATDFFTSQGITLLDRGADSLDLDGDVGLDRDDVLTITFSAVVDSDVHAGENLTNCIDIEWESLEDDNTVYTTFNSNGVERTGDAGDAGESNDYTTRDCATVTAASPTVEKTILGTNQAFTGNDPGGNPYLTIGETIQYQVVLTMSEGYTYDFSVTDTLDQGLALVSVDSISGHADLFSTVTGGAIGIDPDVFFQEAVTTGSDGQIIQFDFGTIQNIGNNPADEEITITYTAVVLNSNDGHTDRGDALGNTVTASWDRQDDDQTTPADLDSITDEAPDATVVEPDVVVTKTVDNPTPDAGDVVTFTIVVQNPVVDDTFTDAFDVTLEDVVPAGWTLVGSLASTAGQAPDVMNVTGNTVTAKWNSFASGVTSTLTFQATVGQDACPLMNMTNSVEIQWESLDADNTVYSTYNTNAVERTGDTADTGGAANDYIDTDDAAVAIPDLQIAKTAVGSYTIGEDVTFTVTVTLPESTVPSLIITDILPAGLIVDDPATDIVINPSAGFGTLDLPPNKITNITTPDAAESDTLVLDFGEVIVTADPGTTNNTFDILITARVENIVGNTDGTTLTNSVSLTYEDCSGASHDVGSATAAITLVEPEIIATKTITDSDNALQPEDDGDTSTADVLGDIFTANTNFENTGTANAYDIILTDHLAPGTVLDTGSIILTDPAGVEFLDTDYVVSNTISDTAPYFTVTITKAGFALAQGESIDMDYEFRVEGAWFAAGAHCNLVDANWSSMAASPAGERVYDDTVTANPGLSQDGEVLPVSGENDKAAACFTVPEGDATLGDWVFYDMNANNSMDIGVDVGIPGVQVVTTVTLAGGATYTAVATTDDDGKYLFTHLHGAPYTVNLVSATLPGGATQVYEGGTDHTIDNSISVTIVNDGTYLDADFGFIGDGKIGDFVWYDLNNNGLQDDSGFGINGATVQLEADLDGDGTIDYLITTTTADSPTGDPGYYVFDNLLYSNYTITVMALPGGIATYTQTADPDALLDSSSTVVVADWTADTDKFIDNQDFGYITGGSIGNYIWEDINVDKLQQVGELGIGGVRVVLSGVDINHDGVLDTLSTITAADGSYHFMGLIAGTYTITADETTLPAGYAQTYDFQWNAVGGDGLNNQATYTLNTDERFDEIDFGYTKTGSIGDTVWFDANANTVQDSGEPGLSGVIVTLTGDVDLDGVIDTLTTVTDAAGQYLFDDLPTGNYDITVDPVILPGGMRQTYDADGIATADIANVALGYDEDNRNTDFGYTGTGSIGDTVWYDANRNGLLDGTESGIANVLMTLDADINSDGVVDYTIAKRTNGSGKYLFENLPAGRYSITLDPTTLPPNLVQTYDPDSQMDGSSNITLGTGENNLAQDFAYALPSVPPKPPQPMVPPRPFFPEPPDMHDGGGDDDRYDVDDFLEGPALSQRTGVFQPALNSMPTMYTGQAEPGTMLHLTMYDAQGNVLATHMAPVDTGGNWLANLQVGPESETPHRVVIQQNAAVYNRSTEGGFNLRTNFSPSFGSKAVTSLKGDVSSVMGGLAEQVVEDLHKLYNGSVDVRWDSTKPYESSVVSTNPGQNNAL